MSRIRCGGALGAEAHERWGSGALQRAGHNDGEVAAAEFGRDGMARGGGVQREGEWVQEVAGVLRGAVEKQELACGAAQRRRQRKQGGREVEDEGWT